MTLWCFLGLESACVNCDNVDNPERNVPIAVMTATCTVAVICIVSTNIMAGIIPNAELAASNAPFGLVFARMFAPEAGHVVTAMLVFSCLGSTLSWQYTIAKVFQLSAREGFFPSVFSKVNRWGFPAVGLIIITLIQTGFTFMTASPSLLKQFNMLVDLAVVTNLIPFILSMAAIPMIMKMANVPVAQTRKYTFFGLIGALYSFYAISSLGYVEMFWGSLATFVGWTFWGFLSTKYADEHPIHLLRDSQFEDID
jgi:putrescine:ornithine antiporter